MEQVTQRAPLVPAAALVAALVLAGCGADVAPTGPSPTTPSPTLSGPAAEAGPDELVLRVAVVGGFVAPTSLLSRLPAVSVYADGRVVTPVEEVALASGAVPALPAAVVRDVGPDGVAELVRRARDAGVGTDVDLGDPLIADAGTTRFTVRDDGATLTTDAYALQEVGVDVGQDGGPGTGVSQGDGSSGLTPAQAAARQRLLDLRDALVDVGTTLDDVGPPIPYEPGALAVLAAPASGTAGDQQPLPWPGPALPGEPMGLSEATCVTAEGAALGPALDAAASADTHQPWSSGGSSWSLAFRPLLPDERGCADLVPQG